MLIGLTAARLAVAFLLLTAPIASDAQSARTMPRIGILPPGPIAERTPLWEAFRQGLRELGYVEGRNISLIFPSEEVTPERLPYLAAELAPLKVDVIVAATTGAVEAATKSTKTIPIVTPVSIGLVEAGFVASIARPGGNIIGLNYMSSDVRWQTAGASEIDRSKSIPHCRSFKSNGPRRAAPAVGAGKRCKGIGRTASAHRSEQRWRLDDGFSSRKKGRS